MDIISRAMEKGLHLCEKIDLKNQTWEAFMKNKESKKLFIFGMGGGMGYFLRKYGHSMEADGIIDNDVKKHGHKLGWYIADAEQTEYENMVIEGSDLLCGYCGEDVAVLITSINFYLSIALQLKRMGIENIYILLMLEADKRRNHRNEIWEDDEEIRAEYIKWCCRREIEKNKVVMMIGVYGDHARQITRELLKFGEDLDIVWLVDNPDVEKPRGVRLVYMGNWKRYIYEMETAKIWLFDDLVHGFIQKRKGQIYIQVKHWSSITLKMFYLDDKASYRTPGLRDGIKRDGERMDYLFSGSAFDEESCRSGFGFQGKAVRVGSARSDILFDKTVRTKVLEGYGLNRDARICLYVPTYRLDELERTQSMSILLDMQALLEVLESKWTGEWFLFVRLHPSLNLRNDILPAERHIINVQSYSCSEELVAASDIMITDYSSIMFEEAYKMAPVFLYAPDREEFIDGERNLLLDYDSLPFPIAQSNEELHQIIREFDKKEYEINLTAFLENYDVHEDGHAGERAAEFIRELLDGSAEEREL